MTTADVCAICGEQEPDRRLLHDCFRCGRLYHLNPYSNQPGKDCGDAILGEEFGLFYYCNDCLVAMTEEHRAASEPAPSAASAPPTEVPPLPPRPQRPPSTRRYRRIERP